MTVQVILKSGNKITYPNVKRIVTNTIDNAIDIFATEKDVEQESIRNIAKIEIVEFTD